MEAIEVASASDEATANEAEGGENKGSTKVKVRKIYAAAAGVAGGGGKSGGSQGGGGDSEVITLSLENNLMIVQAAVIALVIMAGGCVSMFLYYRNELDHNTRKTETA